jgi:peptidoglycan/LPS O-acetylase OafA/YrhL
MLAGYGAIAAIYGFSALRSRSASAIAGASLVAAFAALTVGIALFHSWNNDFQAQGRYLFPILPMLGAGLLLVREHLPARALLAATAFCFALSLYSYVFIGLTHVPGSF